VMIQSLFYLLFCIMKQNGRTKRFWLMPQTSPYLLRCLPVLPSSGKKEFWGLVPLKLLDIPGKCSVSFAGWYKVVLLWRYSRRLSSNSRLVIAFSAKHALKGINQYNPLFLYKSPFKSILSC